MSEWARRSIWKPAKLAPASRARSSTVGMSRSLSPGMIGATSTPVRRPASESPRSASRRLAGRGAPGSIARPHASSAKGIETVTVRSARSFSSFNSSRSRRIRTLFVTIATGFAWSRKASRQRRVSSYRASIGW